MWWIWIRWLWFWRWRNKHGGNFQKILRRSFKKKRRKCKKSRRTGWKEKKWTLRCSSQKISSSQCKVFCSSPRTLPYGITIRLYEIRNDIYRIRLYVCRKLYCLNENFYARWKRRIQFFKICFKIKKSKENRWSKTSRPQKT